MAECELALLCVCVYGWQYVLQLNIRTLSDLGIRSRNSGHTASGPARGGGSKSGFSVVAQYRMVSCSQRMTTWPPMKRCQGGGQH